MKTTVVIPNYNGKHFLQDCLDSLLQSTVEIAVIVVDNGSTDGSVSWIQEHFPQVKLICFSENKGCPLYTSDPADERYSVDLGCRRIITNNRT